MKNRLLFEKVMLSIAPAVTKYHLDLQLDSKQKGESDFIMHRDTARYIAEDCTDIARTIVEEVERQKEQSRSALKPVKGEDKSKEDQVQASAKADMERSSATKGRARSTVPTNGSIKKA